jgi:hypothetical protein
MASQNAEDDSALLTPRVKPFTLIMGDLRI